MFWKLSKYQKSQISASNHKILNQWTQISNRNWLIWKKAQCNWICPLCCEGIGNEIHYLNECNDSVIVETRETLLKPFQTKWKGVDQITSEELCKAIVGCQNDNILNDIGNLSIICKKCLRNKLYRHKNLTRIIIYWKRSG